MGEQFWGRVLALLLLIAAAPVIGVAILAIRLDSPGPGIFRQERVGRGRKRFVCYKLRTMRTGTRQVATHQVGEAAVTRLGRMLRGSKVDELPQLWNVVRGDMCLVGPRPCLPSQHELVRAREERGVYAVPPGITGLAQIRGIDMSDPIALAECDAEYLRSRSFRFDFRILVGTFQPSALRDRVVP